MQSKECGDDTIRAEGLRIGMGSQYWRITCSAFFVPLAAFVLLTPSSGRADDNDRGIGREVSVLLAKIESLPAAVSALQAQVNAVQTANTLLKNEINILKTSNANLQNQVNSLKTSNTALQGKLAAVQANPVFNLAPLASYVTVRFGLERGVAGPHIFFTGANIHIVSGSGFTDDRGTPYGLGNLIIGYDEDPKDPLPADLINGLPTMQTAGTPSTLNTGDRGGSHNLVIGAANRFTRSAFGGFVAGQRNTISGVGASVSGGFLCGSGLLDSVSGGLRNTAGGVFSVVSGGGFNSASGELASVNGGFENEASGTSASISGGTENIANALFASVAGGANNTSGGEGTVVLGGLDFTTTGFFSIVPQPSSFPK